MKIGLLRLGTDLADPMALDDSASVAELRRIVRERLEVDGKMGVKLVHETQVLEDVDTLTSCGLEDGSTVVVILENPGPIVLKTSRLRHRSGLETKTHPAAKSEKLSHGIAEIKVAVSTFRDQDRGDCGANLFLTLKNEDGSVLAKQNLFGTYRQEGYPYDAHPPPLTFNDDNDLVALAKPGHFFQMEYTIGSLGQIAVDDWTCEIFYESSSCTAPSQVVDFKFSSLRTRSGS